MCPHLKATDAHLCMHCIKKTLLNLSKVSESKLISISFHILLVLGVSENLAYILPASIAQSFNINIVKNVVILFCVHGKCHKQLALLSARISRFKICQVDERYTC